VKVITCSTVVLSATIVLLIGTAFQMPLLLDFSGDIFVPKCFVVF